METAAPCTVSAGTQVLIAALDANLEAASTPQVYRPLDPAQRLSLQMVALLQSLDSQVFL
jgi:hypothetical protein